MGPNPIDAGLLARLGLGHRAAAFRLEQVAGEWREVWQVDDQVRCLVRVEGDERAREMLFAEVGALAAGGAVIVDLAPVGSPLLWDAAGRELLVHEGPDGAPAPVVRVTRARDDARGLAAIPYSTEYPDRAGRTAGDRVTAWFEQTTIPGAAKRSRSARERLSAADRRALTGEAMNGHLRSDAAFRDGAYPPARFEISELDVATQRTRVLAASEPVPEPAPLGGSKRRGRIGNAVLNEYVADVFGSRGDYERPAEPLDDESTAGIGLPIEDAEARLDIAGLIERAHLSPRELEAFSLRAEDKTYADIATTMKVELGTVKALISTARKKLGFEASRSLTEYRRTA